MRDDGYMYLVYLCMGLMLFLRTAKIIKYFNVHQLQIQRIPS